MFHDANLKLLPLFAKVSKTKQQYQYFPAWGYVLVRWLSGTGEPVLGNKGLLVGVVGGEWFYFV